MEIKYSIILGDHNILLETNCVLFDKDIWSNTNILGSYEVTQIVA